MLGRTACFQVSTSMLESATPTALLRVVCTQILRHCARLSRFEAQLRFCGLLRPRQTSSSPAMADISAENSPHYQRMPNADYGSTNATVAAGPTNGEWKEDGRPNGVSVNGNRDAPGSSSLAAASSQPNSAPQPSKYESPVAIGHLPEQSVTHVNFHNVEDDDEESVQARLSPHEHTLEHGSSSQESSRQNLVPLEFPASSSSSSSSSSSAAAAVTSNVPATMIAFINFHSGGKTGEMLAKDLQKALGEDKVFDLKGDKGPAKGSVEQAM